MKAKEYLKIKYDEYHVISVMELLDYKSMYQLMDEFSEYQNKELIHKNDKLKEANSERQLKIEQLIDNLKNQ